MRAYIIPRCSCIGKTLRIFLTHLIHLIWLLLLMTVASSQTSFCRVVMQAGLFFCFDDFDLIVRAHKTILLRPTQVCKGCHVPMNWSSYQDHHKTDTTKEPPALLLLLYTFFARHFFACSHPLLVVHYCFNPLPFFTTYH